MRLLALLLLLVLKGIWRAQAYGEVLYHNIAFFLSYTIVRRRTADIERLATEVFRAFVEETSRSSRFRAKLRVGYSLARHPGYRVHPDGTSDPICWEAPIGITLYIHNKPVCGMAVQFCGKVLKIRQLQGIKDVRLPGVLREAWTQVFARSCCRYASRRSFDCVRIYRADQSLYYRYPVLQGIHGNPSQADLSTLRKRMCRRYDGTAEALGFAPKRRYYEWKAPKKEWY